MSQSEDMPGYTGDSVNSVREEESTTTPTCLALHIAKKANQKGETEVEISVKENSKPLPTRARKPAKPLGLY